MQKEHDCISSDTPGCTSFATFLPWPHFVVVCDLLLNRQIATKNLFGNLITQGIYWGCFKHFFIYIYITRQNGSIFYKKKVYLTLSCLFLFSLIRKGSLTSCEEELREVRSNHHKERLLVIMLLKTFLTLFIKYY